MSHSISVVCCENRQQTTGTRRVHQIVHAWACAATRDTLSSPDLQGERGRRCAAVYANTTPMVRRRSKRGLAARPVRGPAAGAGNIVETTRCNQAKAARLGTCSKLRQLAGSAAKRNPLQRLAHTCHVGGPVSRHGTPARSISRPRARRGRRAHLLSTSLTRYTSWKPNPGCVAEPTHAD